MAKFPKQNLPRGKKLFATDVTKTGVDVAASLSAKGIDSENLKNPLVPWRLNINQPEINTYAFTDKEAAIAFPFTLPPPQDLWNSQGQVNYEELAVVLDEMSLSFDQRAEAAAMLNTGALRGAAEVNQVEILLVEKQQWYFNSQMTSQVPERVLFRRVLSPDDFASLNMPLVQSDLNIQLSPYKTYAIQLNAPYLNQANNPYNTDFFLFSMNISLKGYWTRKSSTEQTQPFGSNEPDVQNAPYYTSDNNDTVSQTVPAGGTTIEATTLNTNWNSLDQKLFDKIEGGYGPNSELGRYGHMTETMGYDIIAVPLWNRAFRQSLSGFYSINQAPYFIPWTGAPAYNYIYDRAIIPIMYPMEIHHVFCSWSLVSPAIPGIPPPLGEPLGTHPDSPDVFWQVGVSIGSGKKSDLFAKQQVAAVEWNVNPIDPLYYQNFLIDRYRVKDYGTVMSSTTDVPAWDYALMSVPLMVYDTGVDGEGYYRQGKPVFVGRGNSWTGSNDSERRTKLPQYNVVVPPAIPNIATANDYPTTRGLENYIEIASLIGSYAGLENPSPADSVLTGEGGMWVYLVVKKALVKNSERVR